MDDFENRDIETKESQYSIVFDVIEKHGRTALGLMANASWNLDPKRLLFTFSRYKFVSKMLSGKNHVLEIGCADAVGTRIVQQEVRKLTAIDFDPIFIDDVKSRMDPAWPFECFEHDVLKAPVPGKYDAVYCLDVFEHINPDDEDTFLKNFIASIDMNGVAIIGIPSLESQAYASPQSRAGHVNCKSGIDFKVSLQKYFKNVFMFSMNDEVVHTGFFPMANYFLALCTV